MTIDANPPPEVTALGDMLVATALCVSLGITLSKIYYPRRDMTAAQTPCIPIEGTEAQTERIAEMGAAGNHTGTLTGVLFVEATVTIAQMESYGRSLKSQLASLSTGLPVRSISVELASDPTPAMRAADDSGGASANASYRSIRFTLGWGLNP